MDATNVFNPQLWGKLTRKEAEENNAPYVRNGENKELREYVKQKFNIDHDRFHFEEGNGDWLLVMANGSEMVKQNPS